MKTELNGKALEAIGELCSEDALEANISLMEDSLDMILSGELPEEPELTFDLVRAYRRLSKQFKTILENVKE